MTDKNRDPWEEIGLERCPECGTYHHGSHDPGLCRWMKQQRIDPTSWVNMGLEQCPECGALTKLDQHSSEDCERVRKMLTDPKEAA